MPAPLFQRVIKIGHSIGIVIPREITRGLEIHRGDIVSLSVRHAQHISLRLFTPIEEQELLKQSKNIPDETIEY